MKMRNDRMAERGTLLVEAIAMLGLIALVTPTLYKKSAERLQEIQDINTASQARTMNSIIDTFMKTNYALLMQETSSSPNNTVEIAYNDNTANYFELGYSAFVPFGYNPGDLKNYTAPRIYIHRDKDALVSYIVYPTMTDPGKKRAARVASLVGANGGSIFKPISGSSTALEVFGTGGAWHLDREMMDEMNISNSAIVENSLVVTSTEPVTMSSMDSEKFLYRVPGEEFDYHNTMVTDLYMGGHHEETKWSELSRDYYSIFNVRKLTLNTRCSHAIMATTSSTADCDPNVADLYIGKPTAGEVGTASPSPNTRGVSEGNTGAAWIYGNLKALNENFRLFRDNNSSRVERTTAGNEYDVMEFVRTTAEGNSSAALTVLRAENKMGSSRVSMMDDFLQVRDAQSDDADNDTFEFLLGKSGSSGTGTFIHALTYGGDNLLRLNSPDDFGDLTASSFVTHINRRGGYVYINGGADSSVTMKTIINDAGGSLEAGQSGEWINANNTGPWAEVNILSGSSMANTSADLREFTVGNRGASSLANMIYANSGKTTLRGGQVRVYNPEVVGTSHDSSIIGGATLLNTFNINGEQEGVPSTLEGATALTSRYTDILGSTYMGRGDMLAQEDPGDNVYSRQYWTLGVAGSAWVDKLLWAREAWFKKAGVQELHAGFDNYLDYRTNSSAAWLNAYNDSVVIRNHQIARNNPFSKEDNSSDTMLYVDSSRVTLRDLDGAYMQLRDNTAYLGNEDNFFYVSSAGTAGYSSAAYMVGSTLANIYTQENLRNGVVNVQKDALKLKGHPGSSDVYGNTVEAKAGIFSIQTMGATEGSAYAQFYADDANIRTRYVDFMVEDNDSSAIFKVMPNSAKSSSEANVQVHGTLHVNDNDVIHVASHADNRAGSSDKDAHAMLEVDPSYVQIWARNQNNDSSWGGYAKNPGEYFAMLKINPSDVSGSTSVSEATNDASIYIRRGAIELEPSISSGDGGDVSSSYGADQGVGYIKANRLVSNVKNLAIPSTAGTHNSGSGAYDQYMVNPAYTSVMHDIKLTTRGGARLSDILPDYILKGVYNLVNNRIETKSSNEIDDMSQWADPYIGIVPYASCPPGYYNQGTVIPISFNMGQAGELIRASHTGRQTEGDNRWVVNPYPRQAAIIKESFRNGVLDIANPELNEFSSYTYTDVTHGDDVHGGFSTHVTTRTEGWFWGQKAVHTDPNGTTSSKVMTGDNYGTSWGNYRPWRYADDGSNWQVLAEPLYFQQNTWLKTSVVPKDKGWWAYMGFLYDVSVWGNMFGVDGGETIRSNYNEDGYNDTNNPPAELPGTYKWNFFPVPTNTLEGHATVYCYFDRTKFKDGGWENLVDQIDQLGSITSGNANYRTPGDYENNKPEEYKQRLNDPSLKYTDPW